MLRITTGTAKNKRLKTPDIEGFRGVQEKAKLSLFSILGDKIEGAVCLDLFAGSGNLGIEALSRGASWCDFVDVNSKCTDVIEENLHNCGFLEISQVFRKSAVKYLTLCDTLYDVIFTDPFYSNTSQNHMFKIIETTLKEGGKIIYFHANTFNPEGLLSNTSFKITDRRRFGESIFDLIEKGKKNGVVKAAAF
jgi:16S rRNA (guanine(966)-N(2))-methyltransferase RsmD